MMRAPWLGRFAVALIRDVMVHVAIALAAGTTLFLVVDFVEVGNLAADHATSKDLLALSLFSIPRVFKLLLPVAAPIGTLTAVGGQLRRLEIAALLAAGASPAAVLKPVAVAALLWGVTYAVVVDRLVPPATSKLSVVRRRVGLPTRSQGGLTGRHTWLKGRDQLYRVRALAAADGAVLDSVLILDVADGALRHRWDVERLIFADGRWRGEGIVHRALTDDGLVTERHAAAPLAIAELPQDFLGGIAIPERLSYAALRGAAATRERLGRPALEHRVELHRRHTAPVSLLLAMVLAAAVALRLGRGQSLAAALGWGAGLGFSVWLVRELARLAGNAGTVAPGVAAHLAPLLLLALVAAAWVLVERRGIAEGA